MINDAFTAGVVPGGLISHSDIKILICDVLRSVDGPVSHEDLVGVLADRGLANYFELSGSVSELIDAGHVGQSEEGYTLTSTGAQIADMLAADLPATVRERALSAVEEAVAVSKKKRQNRAEIVPVDNGYEVRCSITDPDLGLLYALTVYSPTAASAEKIRDNFVDKAERLLRQDLSLLTGDEL